MNLAFYKGKRVFITGHTGFKGAWLCHMLKGAGAFVTGYALPPEEGGVFALASAGEGIVSYIGDIRDMQGLSRAFQEAAPEIVLHLAAQPLVLYSYAQPAYTFETNIMGTVHLLECARRSNSVRSVVIVTTDKVYKNHECAAGYSEQDPLGGHDPYSASKACVEVISNSYVHSYLKLKGIPLSTVRAGNVIGGGDISANRILPDCVRAAVAGERILLRNPHSVRPYQHVLEPLLAYLIIAQRQFEDSALADCYNIGPNETDCISTAELTTYFCEAWGNGQSWVAACDAGAPREAGFLRLNCDKMRATFGWRPIWDVKTAVEKTVEWEQARLAGRDIRAVMDRQIQEYMGIWSNGRSA